MAPTLSAQGESDEERRERVAMLGLASIKGVGYWTLRKVYTRIGSFAKAADSLSADDLRELLAAAGAKLARREPGDAWTNHRGQIERHGAAMLDELTALGVRLIFETDPEYPEQLLGTADWPRWLFVQGNAALLHRNSIALVGTREPSEDGYFLADFACACLYETEAVTVSGLAEGIDTRVHSLSLRYHVPTIAVLGTGVLHDFPKSSSGLRRAIVKAGGAIVTEYLPGDTYSKENFVRRNRIQAALASAVVPLEWRAKSGTTHTVKFAAGAQRPIACLRLPDWDADRGEIALARDLGATIFTVPGDESAFRDYVGKATRGELPEPASRGGADEPGRAAAQRSLFGDGDSGGD